MQAVKILRLILDVPQLELAKHAGISIRQLARLEAKGAPLTREATMQIDDAFTKLIEERCQQSQRS